MGQNKITFDFQNGIFELNGMDIGDICTGAEIKITPGRFPEVTLHFKSSTKIITDNSKIYCCTRLAAAATTDDNKPATVEASST